MRIIKCGVALALVCFCAIAIRLYLVEKDIQNRPIVISNLSQSGYTPEGVFGHGNLVVDGGLVGWIVYDLPTADGQVQKICEQGASQNTAADIDFIHYNNEWIKLRTGTVTFKPEGLEVSPKTTKWRGTIKSKTAFSVRSPDWPYRLKILHGKLLYANLSPLNYLQDLKRSNPSCADMPEP